LIADLPPSHPLVQFSDYVYSYAARFVGGNTVPPRVRVGGLLPGYAAMTYTQTRTVVLPLRPAVLMHASKRYRWNFRQADAVQTLIHEHLHVAGSGYAAMHSRDPLDHRLEEAIVDTVTLDILPRVTWAITRQRHGGTPHYGRCYLRIRAASIKAVGWRGARAWRVALLHAGPAERRAALRATGTDPKDVCP